jgi:hypothetical protein
MIYCIAIGSFPAPVGRNVCSYKIPRNGANYRDEITEKVKIGYFQVGHTCGMISPAEFFAPKGKKSGTFSRNIRLKIRKSIQKEINEL